MAEASLRGTRLGSTSYENDAHIVPIDRMFVTYHCPKGHSTTVPYAADAEEVPFVWECKCGAEAERHDVERPAAKEVKHGRTHWDMLLERRTIDDLEVLLSERLGLLKAYRSEKVRKSA